VSASVRGVNRESKSSPPPSTRTPTLNTPLSPSQDFDVFRQLVRQPFPFTRQRERKKLIRKQTLEKTQETIILALPAFP
jgi:hypothetical protein